MEIKADATMRIVRPSLLYGSEACILGPIEMRIVRRTAKPNDIQ